MTTASEIKLRINEKKVKKLLATLARGGVLNSHAKAVAWTQEIFFVQKVGDKRRYVTPPEASKIISGSM